jgi:hypothetical protein
MNDFAKEYPNIDKMDLNKVWGILSNMQNNNPQKYKKFMGKKHKFLTRFIVLRSHTSLSEENDGARKDQA